MIATDRFVFIHLHKSGGTFVNECLLRFIPGAHRLGYHLPRTLIPSALSHLPVLGLARTPWSYYVSWYAFQSTRPVPNELYRILSEDGRLGFEATIRNMLDLGTVDTHLDPLIAALPSQYSGTGLNVPGFALASIRGTRVGFYAWLYRYMFSGGAGTLHVGRMENIRADLLEMLAAVGQPVTEPMRQFILQHEPMNISSHRPYTECYSDSLRDLVAERDGEIIAAQRCHFGD